MSGASKGLLLHLVVAKEEERGRRKKEGDAAAEKPVFSTPVSERKPIFVGEISRLTGGGGCGAPHTTIPESTYSVPRPSCSVCVVLLLLWIFSGDQAKEVNCSRSIVANKEGSASSSKQLLLPHLC